MWMRIISVGVVLGLGVMGIALAQQTGQQPKDQASQKAKLRDRVVKLRVEVELMELEHDATRADILDMTKDIRNSESDSPEQVQRIALGFLSLTEGEALGKLAQEKEAEKAAEQIDKVVQEAHKKTLDEAKALRERRKKAYAKQAEELAGKRLELADVEKNYNDAR